MVLLSAVRTVLIHLVHTQREPHPWPSDSSPCALELKKQTIHELTAAGEQHRSRVLPAAPGATPSDLIEASVGDANITWASSDSCTTPSTPPKPEATLLQRSVVLSPRNTILSI